MLEIRKWWNSSRVSKDRKLKAKTTKGRRFEEWERDELLAYFERFKCRHEGEKPRIWIVTVGNPTSKMFWYVGEELPSWILRRVKNGTFKSRQTNRRMVFRYPKRSKEYCLHHASIECRPRPVKGYWFKLKDFGGSVQKSAGAASGFAQKWERGREKRNRTSKSMDAHLYRVHYRVTGLTFAYYVTMEPLVVDETKWFWKWFVPVELTHEELKKEIVR